MVDIDNCLSRIDPKSSRLRNIRQASHIRNTTVKRLWTTRHMHRFISGPKSVWCHICRLLQYKRRFSLRDTKECSSWEEETEWNCFPRLFVVETGLEDIFVCSLHRSVSECFKARMTMRIWSSYLWWTNCVLDVKRCFRINDLGCFSIWFLYYSKWTEFDCVIKLFRVICSGQTCNS